MGILDLGILIATAGRLCLIIAVAEADRNRFLQGSRLRRWIGGACRRVMGIPREAAVAGAVMIRVLHGSGRLIRLLDG